MRPIARHELVADLLLFRVSLGQELGGEQALGEVVDPPVALPADERQDAGLGERLQDRPDRVGRPPIPLDRGARLDVR